MKMFNKALFSLLFTALMLLGFFYNVEANCMTDDCVSMNGLSTPTEAAAVSSSGGGEFDLDFFDPFFFIDEVVFNFYGASDELLYSGSFTKEEMKNNQELKSWIKKSEFLLRAGNQYYYLLNE